jgi:predicted metal-dependent peptidase
MSLSVLEDSIIYLLHTEPFYAHLLMRMRRMKTTKIETAGVRITDGIDLLYNENYLIKQKTAHGIKAPAGILKHECEHVLFLHLGGRQEGFEHKKFNIAADCSINQFNSLIDGMKEDIVTLDNFKKLVENPNVEAQQTLEYYYGLLQKKSDEKKGDPEFQKMLDQMSESLDDHGTWDESVCGEAQKRIAQYAVNQAATSTGRGNLPANIAKQIETMNKETLNWKSILRRFWSRGVTVEIKSTRMRVNRRWGIAQPGKRTNPLVHVAMVIDTSGSMGDDDIDAIFCEAKRIHDTGATVTIIECDTEVHKTWTYQGKNNVEVHGRGGTSFQPGLDAAAKADADVCIYFTDGDGEQDFKLPKMPVLWVLTREGHSGTVPEKGLKVWMKTK